MSAPRRFPDGELTPEALADPEYRFRMLLLHSSPPGWDYWGDIVARTRGALMVAVCCTNHAEVQLNALMPRGVHFDLVAVRAGVREGPDEREQGIGDAAKFIVKWQSEQYPARFIGYSSRQAQVAQMVHAGITSTDALEIPGLERALVGMLRQVSPRQRRRTRAGH